MNEFKQQETIPRAVLYRFTQWSVVTPILLTYFQGKIDRAGNVCPKGPFVLVSNHASYFDPPFLSCIASRPIAYMAKEELFAVPFLKQIISLYGAYPVKRGSSDRGALKAALNALQEGWAVGIFLEGTRTFDARISEPKLGAALIAAKAQVPLVPVSLWGTEKILVKGKRLPQPVPVTLRLGPVILPPKSTKREELQAITEKCALVINQMHAQGR